MRKTNLAVSEGEICEPHAVGSLKIRIMMIDNDSENSVKVKVRKTSVKVKVKKTSVKVKVKLK